MKVAVAFSLGLVVVAMLAVAVSVGISFIHEGVYKFVVTFSNSALGHRDHRCGGGERL